MNANKLPLARASLLLPFAHYYLMQGRDFSTLCTELQVEHFDFSDPGALLPIEKAHAIMDRISQDLAEPHLSAHIGKQCADTDGPPFDTAKQDASSLGHLLIKLTRSFGSEATTGTMKFTVNDKHAIIDGRRTYRPGPAAKHGSAMFNSFLLTLIKNAVGSAWTEASVLVQSPDRLSFPDWLLSANQVVSSSPDRFMIRFPADWCDSIPVFPVKAGETSDQQPNPIDDNVVENLRYLILSYVGNRRLTLKQAAQQLDMPVRTLQRVLHRNGVQFGTLSSETRLVSARGKLESTALPIKQIAEEHGYRNPANFSRDFKKKFGHSPSDMRAVTIR